MVRGGVKPNSFATASGSFTTMLMKACKTGHCWALLGSGLRLQYTSQDLQSVAATATQSHDIIARLPHISPSVCFKNLNNGVVQNHRQCHLESCCCLRIGLSLILLHVHVAHQDDRPSAVARHVIQVHTFVQVSKLMTCQLGGGLSMSFTRAASAFPVFMCGSLACH